MFYGTNPKPTITFDKFIDKGESSTWPPGLNDEDYKNVYLNRFFLVKGKFDGKDRATIYQRTSNGYQAIAELGPNLAYDNWTVELNEKGFEKTKHQKADPVGNKVYFDIEEQTAKIQLQELGNVVADIWDVIYTKKNEENTRETSLAFSDKKERSADMEKNVTLGSAITYLQNLIGRKICYNKDTYENLEAFKEAMKNFSKPYPFYIYIDEENDYYKVWKNDTEIESKIIPDFNPETTILGLMVELKEYLQKIFFLDGKPFKLGEKEEICAANTTAFGNNMLNTDQSNRVIEYDDNENNYYKNEIGNISWGENSSTFGNNNLTKGKNAFAQGEGCVAAGNNSSAIGNAVVARGEGAHAEGRGGFSEKEFNVEIQPIWDDVLSKYCNLNYLKSLYNEVAFDMAPNDWLPTKEEIIEETEESTEETALNKFLNNYYVCEWDIDNDIPTNDAVGYNDKITIEEANGKKHEFLVPKFNEKFSKLLNYNESFFIGYTNFLCDEFLERIQLTSERVLTDLSIGALGDFSHVEGLETKALYSAHAEGQRTFANGNYSHTEGSHTIANRENSHAEGSYTTAGIPDQIVEIGGARFTIIGNGNNSHAEGENTTTYGKNSHAEGLNTNAYGNNSHAEGRTTWALGQDSHAGGYHTMASGRESFCGGNENATVGRLSFAFGRSHNFNETLLESYVGNGFTDKFNTDWSNEKYFEEFSQFIKSYSGHTGENDTKLYPDKNFYPYVKENSEKNNRVTGSCVNSAFQAAFGVNSIVMGTDNIALGANSITLGQYNLALHNNALLFGKGLISQDLITILDVERCRTIVGQYNYVNTESEEKDNDPSNSIFIVGTGTYSNDGELRRMNGFQVGMANPSIATWGMTSNDGYRGYVRVATQKPTNDDIIFYFTPGLSANESEKIFAKKHYLGSSNYPWTQLYVETIGDSSNKVSRIYCSATYSEGNGLTSDKRLKTEQDKSILQTQLAFYNNLNPIAYKYKNETANDNYSRTHVGFFAQEVEQLITDSGLTNEECALVQILDLDEPTELCPDGKRYYLNYNELHALHVAKNQEQDKRIDKLENKIKELEELLKGVINDK